MSSTTATGLAPTEESAQAQPRYALSFTFDDGPDETWTPRMLEQLARCEVTATFFMVGERVRAHPDLARTVLAAGHEIQLHCDRHIRHTELTEAELQLDTEMALDALATVDVRPRLWRAPWGICTDASVRAGAQVLIVCSEVLYYLQPSALADAIGWIKTQLSFGASVLTVSWRGIGRDEPLSGDEVHDRLARELARWHALDARQEQYRLDRFDGR